MFLATNPTTSTLRNTHWRWETQLTPQTPAAATCGRILSNNLKPAFQVHVFFHKKEIQRQVCLRQACQLSNASQKGNSKANVFEAKGKSNWTPLSYQPSIFIWKSYLPFLVINNQHLRISHCAFNFFSYFRWVVLYDFSSLLPSGFQSTSSLK